MINWSLFLSLACSIDIKNPRYVTCNCGTLLLSNQYLHLVDYLFIMNELFVFSMYGVCLPPLVNRKNLREWYACDVNVSRRLINNLCSIFHRVGIFNKIIVVMTVKRLFLTVLVFFITNFSNRKDVLFFASIVYYLCRFEQFFDRLA